MAPKTSRPSFSIISLANPASARALFQAIQGSSKAHIELRRQVFKRIAGNSKLQLQLLRILAKHPGEQRKIVVELAKDRAFRRRLIVFGRTEE
jgi:hypothetical protein